VVTTAAAKPTFQPTFTMMGGRALAFVGAFFAPVILVRIFDQSEFGTYKQLLLITSTLYPFAQLGMAESLYYFLPRNPAEGGKYVANSFLFLAAAGLAAMALLEAVSGRLSGWMRNGALAEYMPLLGVLIWLTVASATVEIVMISRHRYFGAAASYALSDLVRAAFVVVPALLLHSLEAVVVGTVAFALVRLVAGVAYFKWEFRRGFRFDLSLLKAQLAYAVPFGLAIVGDIFLLGFHQYAVSYYFDAATFAIYSVGCLSIPIVDFVLSPAASMLMVRMGQANASGDRPEMLAIWHDTTRKLALMFVPLTALLIVIARDLIVLLFTEAYLASVPVFVIWSSGIVWSALLTDGVLRVYADMRWLLLQTGLRLVLSVALISWSIGAFGLQGAVLLFVLSAAVSKAVTLARVTKLLGVGFGNVLPWRELGGIAIAALLAALAALVLKHELGLGPLPALLVSGVVYTAAYVGLLLRLHLLSPGERLALSGLITRANHGARQAVGMART
jgi:O-antigen/teichoic acid export membrane protein